jgi:hypothetical protein
VSAVRCWALNVPRFQHFSFLNDSSVPHSSVGCFARKFFVLLRLICPALLGTTPERGFPGTRLPDRSIGLVQAA